MIDYIKIEGFKSIKQMELELKPINVLLGSNGSGKSNFLSFFNLLRAIFNRELQHFVMKEKADNLFYFGRKTTAYLGGKVIFSKDGNSNNAYIFRLSPTRDGELFIDKEGSGYNVLREDEEKNYLFSHTKWESTINSKVSYRDAYLADYLAGVQTYHFHDTSDTSFLRKASAAEDNTFLKSDGRNLAAFLFKLKEKHPVVYNRILKMVQSVAPFIHDFIVEPSESKGRENSIELRWIDRNDLNTNFSVYHFSDGTLRFIALATVLLQPEPPSVIIIDEPELGLHPLAIAKLAAMIRVASKKSQIIISTQSVTLVDCFTAEDIITVDRDEAGKQSIFERLKSEDLKIWLDTYALGELWARNIINAGQPFAK
jgi:predicted ATPase